jgi:hypothetical protein
MRKVSAAVAALMVGLFMTNASAFAKGHKKVAGARVHTARASKKAGSPKKVAASKTKKETAEAVPENKQTADASEAKKPGKRGRKKSI